ncbi:MAG: porin family protein [Chitinophagia bacterium]
MKKIIVLSVLVASFFTSNAQTTYGIKGGLNIASVKIVLAESGSTLPTSSKTSFVVGAFLNHPLTESLSIQPEFLYQGMGFKLEGEELSSNYFAIPVLLRYSIAKKINLEAGPQIGFIMSANAMGEDVKKTFNSTDFQFLFGGGYHFTKNIQASIRYGIGLTNNASDGNNSLFGNGTTIKNSALTFGLGYTF